MGMEKLPKQWGYKEKRNKVKSAVKQAKRQP